MPFFRLIKEYAVRNQYKVINIIIREDQQGAATQERARAWSARVVREAQISSPTWREIFYNSISVLSPGLEET